MRMDPKRESPSSDGSSTPKQDPLERRRLQNRLSQRNHRRKIRDRIAKLQERVIANELRAAAALNGWDQTYSPPFMSTHHSPPYYQETESIFSSRGHSPQSTEPSTPFLPSYNFPAPTNTDHLGRLPELSGDPSYYYLESASLNHVNQGIQIENDQNMENFLDSWGNSRTESPTAGSGAPNQPNIYIATESSLPHILRTLKTISSQSKIIVLVSPESLPSLQTGLGTNNTPMNFWSTNPLSGNEADSMPSPMSMTNTSYQCQPQNAYSLTPEIIPRAWTSLGPYPFCALHKTPSLPDDSFCALHI
ncbi:hypothetical protein N7507_002337 [Penicillium longicatenatum]|nr:hypothetical protein N7507_002337 [Penicillium longicatenatum]